MSNSKSRSEELYERLMRDGYTAIEQLLAERKAEEFFLDFKRSADNGVSTKLDQKDRSTFAKAISGFGNSEGGIIIWGIDCRASNGESDGAHELMHLQNAKRFVSLLNDAVSGCTVPPHPKVESHPIESDSSGKGFAVTHIPSSDFAPHQTVNDLKYHMRAGSSFVPVPHAVLAGMFGRRPAPNLYDNLPIYTSRMIEGQIDILAGYMLRNNGRGLAKHAFACIHAIALPGPNCKLNVELKDEVNWQGTVSLGRFFTFTSRENFFLPPGGTSIPIDLHLQIAPPFDRDMLIERTSGCENHHPKRRTNTSTASSIREAFERFVQLRQQEAVTKENAHEIALAIWGEVPTDDE